MAQAENSVVDAEIVTIGEPTTYYELPISDTLRLALISVSHGWSVKTITLKRYTDYNDKEQLSQVNSHDILTACLYGGMIYVYVQHDTFRKKSLKISERELVHGQDFRALCLKFNLLPEELFWPKEFTPSYVSKPDWKEPIDIKYISIEQQAEKLAATVRRTRTLGAYLKKHFPEFEYIASGPVQDAQRDMKNFLSFEDISTFTDPSEIPEWAWKSSGSYHCKKRRNTVLWKKYATEGIIEE